MSNVIIIFIFIFIVSNYIIKLNININNCYNTSNITNDDNINYCINKYSSENITEILNIIIYQLIYKTILIIKK
jgi:hypothetical protein